MRPARPITWWRIRYLVLAAVLFLALALGGLYSLREVLRDDCPRGHPGESGGACYDTHNHPEP